MPNEPLYFLNTGGAASHTGNNDKRRKITASNHVDGGTERPVGNSAQLMDSKTAAAAAAVATTIILPSVTGNQDRRRDLSMAAKAAAAEILGEKNGNDDTVEAPVATTTCTNQAGKKDKISEDNRSAVSKPATRHEGPQTSTNPLNTSLPSPTNGDIQTDIRTNSSEVAVATTTILNQANKKNDKISSGERLKHDGPWLTWWGLLKEYIEERGYFPLTSAIYRGKKLGAWVTRQRSIHHCQCREGGEMNWQIAKLNEIGFVWNPHVTTCGPSSIRQDENWLLWWELLREYTEEKGDFPRTSAVYNGRKLGSWVSRQRSLLHQRQKEGEINWEISMLNALGFVWDCHSTTYCPGQPPEEFTTQTSNNKINNTSSVLLGSQDVTRNNIPVKLPGSNVPSRQRDTQADKKNDSTENKGWSI